MDELPAAAPVDEARVLALTRPHPNLLWQYLILSLLTVLAFPVVAVALYFRYETLRYRFDAQGVSVSYGILFRREAYLTYARIQDIHVRRNLVERWLGLGTVEVETAAGAGAGAETLPGLRDYEMVRDFLYSRMRGAHAQRAPASAEAGASAAAAEGAPVAAGESLQLLREIRDALREVRAAVREGRR